MKLQALFSSKNKCKKIKVPSAAIRLALYRLIMSNIGHWTVLHPFQQYFSHIRMGE